MTRQLTAQPLTPLRRRLRAQIFSLTLCCALLAAAMPVAAPQSRIAIGRPAALVEGRAATSRRPAQTGPAHRAGELLIRFRPGIAERDLFTLVEAKGARRFRLLRGGSGIERLALQPGYDLEAVAAALRAEQAV